VFLKGQAIVTDFFDRVSRLDVIKTLGGVAAGISDQFLRLLDVSLRLAETILSLVDSFDKLTLGLGIPALVVGKLSLSLSSLINGLTNGSKQAGLFAQAVSSAKRPLDGLNSTFESVFLGVTKTQKEIVNLQTRQTALGSTSAKVASRIEVLRKRINEYQNAITRTRVSGATTLGGAQAQKQIDEYQRKITSLSNNLVKYENIAGNLAEKQASLGASVEALSKRKGRLAAGTAFLANTWKNATGAVRGLASALGPVGLLLAALTAIQSANNQIFGEANKITNESKDRSESLAQAITSLTGTATSAQAPLSGFAAAWLNISAILVNATKAVRDLFDALLSSLPKVTSGVGPLEAAFRRAGAVIGFVLGGAIIGGAVGGGPLGAAIGGLVGLVVGLGATSDTTAAELQKVVESAKAVGAAAKSEGKLLQDLGKGLEDAAQKINKTKEAQEALQKELAKKQQAGEGQSQTADLTEKISQNQAELNKQVQEFNSAYVASKRAIEGLAAEQAKIEGIQKKLIQDQKSLAGGDQKQLENLEKGAQLIEKQAELQIKLNKLKNLQAAPPTEPPDQRRAARDARGKEIQRLTEDLEEAGRAVQKFQAEGSVDPAALQKYQEYRAALKQVESALGIVTENLEANRASQERAARAAGILTEEQKKTVSTIGSLNKSLRDNQELLENDVNPNVTPAKWIELNKTIADQGIELQQLRDKAEGLQALFGAQILKIRVDNKEVNDSLENANRLIQFYEKAIAVIDINAPELPKIIGELIEAESRREQLNAKKATITLELLQTGVESGSIIETLSIIDKQLAALEQIKVQIPITSSDIDPVIEEINTLNIRKDLGAKSSAELQRLLDTENANERKRLLDEQTNAEKAAIAERKQALQDELTQVKELAAARIDTLRQLGPAEQALARFREDELRKQARKGSPEERLQARAQLERLSREKEGSGHPEENCRRRKERKGPREKG
jgi:DNA repair exonuclease SbcCD ATPase subunit